MATRGRQWLIGCGVGCAALIVIIIVLVVSFTMWLNRPGELLEPARLRGPDTNGYVAWTLRLEDAGTRNLFDALLTLSRSQSTRDSVLANLGNWLEQMQNQRNEEQIKQLFPMVATWSTRVAEDPDEDLHLLAVSLKSLGNRLLLGDWVLGFAAGRNDTLERIKYRGEQIYVHEDAAFFLRRSGIFFASDLDTARRAVERMDGPQATPTQPTGIESVLSAIPEDRPLRGAFTNQRGEIGRLWKALARLAEVDESDPVPWDEVNHLSLSGGFTDDASLSITLQLATDSTWAAQWETTLTEGLQGVIREMEIPAQLEGTVEPSGVHLEFRIDDLPGLLREAGTGS